MQSERMKTELITNVSHDIKTPLTSIVNYAGLLQRDGLSSPDAPEYLEVLVRQSTRLKKLTEATHRGLQGGDRQSDGPSGGS